MKLMMGNSLKMKKTTYKIDQPNYAKAQKKAYDVATSCNQEKLPLSVKKIIRSFRNLHLQKYTDFAKSRSLSMNEVFDILDSEDGCLWRRSDNVYIILYNDTKDNSGRIRFTLAHELGHYILKHHEKTDKTILSRYALSDKEYDVFEKEANYFAKRLLAPIPLIDLYTANWTSVTANSIGSIFQTSFEMANYIIDDLIKRKRNASIVREGHPMVDNFIDFINRDTNSQICTNCYSLQNKTNKFCITCGNQSLISSNPKDYVIFSIEREKSMKYSKITTDDQGTPLQCPKCEAEGINETFTFCPWCGSFFYNMCTGDNVHDYYDDASIHLRVQQGCGNKLDGGFRYCPDCGSTTSYLEQQILTDWKTEYEAQKSRVNETLDKNELPF